MADFVRIKSQDVWINLDYVVRIELNVDEAASARLTFADGSTFMISDQDRKRLLARFVPKKKKKKKKKTVAAPEAAPDTDGLEDTPPPLA